MYATFFCLILLLRPLKTIYKPLYEFKNVIYHLNRDSKELYTHIRTSIDMLLGKLESMGIWNPPRANWNSNFSWETLEFEFALGLIQCKLEFQFLLGQIEISRFVLGVFWILLT